MLATGTMGRAALVDLLLVIGQRPLLRTSPVHPIANTGGSESLAVGLLPVCLISEHRLLLAVQQRVHLRDVGRRRMSHRQAVHHSALVGADVHLHPEVPVLSLPGLLHLWVAALGSVLRPAWRRNDRRIHNRSRSQQQPFPFQQAVDPFKHRSGQLVLLEQVPEVQNRRLVRDRVLGKLDPCEPPHRLAVVDRFFSSWIREVEPDLQKVDPQHLLQSQRRSSLARLRVMRLDQLQKLPPRHDPVHLGQEPLTPRLLPLVLPRQPRERLLFRHSRLHQISVDPVSTRTSFSTASPSATCSELPQWPISLRLSTIGGRSEMCRLPPTRPRRSWLPYRLRRLNGWRRCR